MPSDPADEAPPTSPSRFMLKKNGLSSVGGQTSSLYPSQKAIGLGGRGASKAPGKLGRWLSKPFQTSNKAVSKSGSAGRKELTTAETRDGQSAAASRTLERAGFQRPAAEQVLVQVRGRGQVLSPAGRDAIRDVVAAVDATGRVKDIRSPLASANAGQVSRDERSAVILFAMKGKADTASERVEPVLGAVDGVAARHPGLRFEEFGSASATKAVNDTIDKDFSRAESISIPLTFGILLVAFGALMAALVPLGLALTSVMAAGGLLALASHGLHVDSSASTMMLLIGLAVGVDYSLLYIRREREERSAGRSNREALDIAAATSGRSVLVSGLTVIAAMAGMFITGQHTFIGMAEATEDVDWDF